MVSQGRVVTIVGVGALGSHVAQFLRNDATHLRVIDFDRVEQKNVLSQFHGKTVVGKNKAEALKQTMNFLWGIRIETAPHKLIAENAQALLETTDLMIDCLDNGAARRIVQSFCRARGKPCLHGALAADGQFGRVVWDERFQIDNEDGPGQATCEGGEHLPFIAVVAGYIARAAQEFLRHRKKIGFEVHPGGATRT